MIAIYRHSIRSEEAKFDLQDTGEAKIAIFRSSRLLDAYMKDNVTMKDEAIARRMKRKNEGDTVM